jgi:DNA-binding CsgD family transcriptional regulator
MGHITILLHIIALAAGLWSAFTIHYKGRITKTLSIEFSRPYFLFTLLFLMVVFLRMSSRYIFTNLSGEPAVYHPAFIFLVTPVRVVVESGMVYAFLQSLWALGDRKIPDNMRSFLAALFAFFVCLYGFEMAAFLRTSTADRLAQINKVFDAAVLLTLLLSLGMNLWSRKNLQKGLLPGASHKAFVGLYLTGFSLLPLVIWLPPPLNVLLISIAYIVINLCPIIWIGYFLPRNRRGFFAPPGGTENWIGLTARYGLTEREKEIIVLILEGRSNKEIEKRLFISHHTVRNHIHNIFEKTGVKSRGRLAFRIREEMKH